MDTLSDSEFESDSEAPTSELEIAEANAERINPAANLSVGWARIIRRPLRRGKHVLLDVCRTADEEGSKGSLNRVVCSRKSKLAKHLRAKKLMWGDLWPC
jgi:ribosomal protein RSM22 (predicted rRNA methylase)